MPKLDTVLAAVAFRLTTEEMGTAAFAFVAVVQVALAEVAFVVVVNTAPLDPAELEAVV